MGLSASMYTGVSGLSNTGEQMNVIGNNIANVNTLGFKGARMYFEDFISQEVNTAGGTAQVGRGTSIGAIYSDFSQGAFETTNEPTDLAIGGKGLFKVSVKGTDTDYYTRAGNFRFDKAGYLVDPHGYVLQGWEIERSEGTSLASSGGSGTDTDTTSGIRGAGAPRDIRMDGFTCSPQATQNVTMVTNLDASDGNDNTSDATDPFFAMFKNWDGTADPPLGDTAYEYQNTIKIFDEGGTAHNLTVYFDQVTASNASGKIMWEYMVTVTPSEDNRTLSGADVGDTSAAGVLMIGTLTFDTGGQLNHMSAFTLPSGASNFKSLASWTPADFNSDGQPVCAPNFTGISNASAATQSSASILSINFGLTNNDPTSAWSNVGTTSNASMIGTVIGNLPEFADPSVNSLASTSFSGSSSTMFQSQDGYTFGFLNSVSVDRDGILSGSYSNGQVLELYQITIYDFVNKWGLNREGSNLFSQTLESGEATAGPANANGLGSIASNSLEQSNVDLAKEFVKMIAAERGFQADSKTITTVDNMLQTVIMMKR